MNNRKMYNTTLDVDLLREIRILAAKLDRRQNDLLEEAIDELLNKYKHQESSMGHSNGWMDKKGKYILCSIFSQFSVIIMAVVYSAFVFCIALHFLYK